MYGGGDAAGWDVDALRTIRRRDFPPGLEPVSAASAAADAVVDTAANALTSAPTGPGGNPNSGGGSEAFAKAVLEASYPCVSAGSKRRHKPCREMRSA